ncbi:hypothetical protein GGX14DRAFT_404393 [Mycena pura]|uniref:t-SNARE coiled-coil homology domain-containing protein n=1 Tax=Mycena pura TaxID=153505 RepID=A0AAD6UVY1_9AGAR|nr:hypothetical protein GGX14DRAFT_404393 [Mycena pura]
MAEAVTGDGDTGDTVKFIQAVSQPTHGPHTARSRRIQSTFVKWNTGPWASSLRSFNDSLDGDSDARRSAGRTSVTVEMMSVTDVDQRRRLKEMTHAVESARTARKMRKRCFFISIVLTLVIVLAVVLAVVLTLENANNK